MTKAVDEKFGEGGELRKQNLMTKTVATSFLGLKESKETQSMTKTVDKTRWSPRTRMQTRSKSYICPNDTLVGHSCGTLLWDTLVEHSCGSLLWDTPVGHSFGTLLRDTLVGHS